MISRTPSLLVVPRSAMNSVPSLQMMRSSFTGLSRFAAFSTYTPQPPRFPSSTPSSYAFVSLCPKVKRPTTLTTVSPTSFLQTLVSQSRQFSTETKNSASSASNPSTSTTTTTTSSTSDSEDGSFLSGLTNISWATVKTYLIVTGLGIGALFAFKIGFNIIDFFGSLNFINVGEIMFAAGIFTGCSLGVLGSIGVRYLSLRPETVYAEAFQRVKSSRSVGRYLGGNPQINPSKFQLLSTKVSALAKNNNKNAQSSTEIIPSSFRAYTYIPGGFRWNEFDRAGYNGFDKFWKHRRIQLFFQVNGPKGQGMVSVECEKKWNGELKYHLLSVDVLSSGERIVLEGDPDYRIYQGIIKLR